MNILHFDSLDQLNESAATIIINLVQTNPSAVLGLATGASPTGIYKEITKAFQKKIVSFRDVTTFNLDEYVGLPKHHIQSYHSFMNTHLFNSIDLPIDQAHIPNGNATDLTQECARYDKLLKQAGHIDLQLLGLGHNGHIGFNEPGTTLLDDTHIVKLREETRINNARYFTSLGEVPTHALTMGVGTILKARMIVLIVIGADKSEIVHRALTGPISMRCPASLLQTHSNLIVCMDSEAGKWFR